MLLVDEAQEMDHEAMHYEAEVVVVIGKRAKHVRENEMLDYVFGIKCGNDISPAGLCDFLSERTPRVKFRPGCSRRTVDACAIRAARITL